MAAGDGSSLVARKAMEELCQRYWYPLYVFARRKVGDRHQAEELIQAFFLQLLKTNAVAEADQTKGRFRSFLLTMLIRFMANQWRRDQAIKRGGKLERLSIDFEYGAEKYAASSTNGETAEIAFDRQWALCLLDIVMAQLRQEYQHGEKESQFELLKPTITIAGDLESYRKIAHELNTTEANVKVLVHRLRKRYRELLCQEIAETLGAGQDVESEIAHLFEIFSSSQR